MNLGENFHRSGEGVGRKITNSLQHFFQLIQISPGPAASPQLSMPTHAEVVPSFVCRSWEEQAFHLSQTDFRGVCFFVMREQENGMIGQNGVMSVYALQNLQAGPPGYTVTGPQILHCP